MEFSSCCVGLCTSSRAISAALHFCCVLTNGADAEQMAPLRKNMLSQAICRSSTNGSQRTYLVCLLPFH